MIEFATVTDKSLLEHAPRLAQIAILNYPPTQPLDVPQANNVDVGHQISFSPNEIHLEVAAENMPELSLTDLPGAINIAPNDDEEHLPKLIEDMVKAHIKDKRLLSCLLSLPTVTPKRRPHLGSSKPAKREIDALAFSPKRTSSQAVTNRYESY